MSARRALVVGASRGLGLGLTERLLERGWRVTATRRRAGADDDLSALADRAAGLTVETVDIDDQELVEALHERLAGAAYDLVFVNAGTTHERWETVADVSTATFERVMVTNALSPMRFVERFADLVAPAGTIGVMSSGQGSVATNTRVTGWEIYRASKSALNQLMRSYAARHPAATLRSLARTWPDFTDDETGWAHLDRVADLVEARGEPLVVVDAESLCADPDAVVADYCDRMGLPRRPDALTWEPGMRPEWELWEEWHGSTSSTTGFGALRPPPPPPGDDQPRLRAAYDAAMPVYERLRAHAI